MSDPRINLNIDVTSKMQEQTPRFEPRDWYPSSQAQELVRKFHEAVDEPIGHTPQTIGLERGALRYDLIKEGLKDFNLAVSKDDLVGQYDGLLEVLLQTYGTLVEMGVDAGPGKREVMRSKMTMVEEVFEKADLFSVLTKQGWKPSYEDYLKYQDLKDPREVLQALPGKPELLTEVIQFVPDENPEAETPVKFEYEHHRENLEKDDTPAPSRKDNFHDKVMRGWTPPIEAQIAYEQHRQKLEYKYPTIRWEGDEMVVNVYSNGEKDVDWDFTTNAPRVIEE